MRPRSVILFALFAIISAVHAHTTAHKDDDAPNKVPLTDRMMQNSFIQYKDEEDKPPTQHKDEQPINELQDAMMEVRELQDAMMEARDQDAMMEARD